MATSKIQVPVEKELRVLAQEVSDEYGYDSLQQVIRIFLTEFGNKRVKPVFINTGDAEWVSPATDKKLRLEVRNLLKERKEGKVVTARSGDEIGKS